jgi:DNA-directed RNA polymerase delta subunit
MSQHHYKLSDVELESVLNALVSVLISDGIFKPISDKCWTLIYPEFQTKSPGKPVFK